MSTRALLNLAMAVLAIALLLVVIYQPGLEPESTPRPITTLDPETVTTIHIERTTRDPLSFNRKEGHWYLQLDSTALPASEFQLHALLRLVHATAASRYPAASVDLAALGLAPPRATVTIDDLQIRFGSTESLENRRYVQLDDTVYLIDDRYQHLINADRAGFIARRLLAGRGAITRLELPGMTLEEGESGWVLEPADDSVTTDTLRQLIDNWQDATALYVRSREEGEATGTVTLHTRDRERPLVLEIIASSPDLVLARRDWGIHYHLPGYLENSLLRLPEPEPDPEPGTEPEPGKE
ncbi:MAG: DUF4340 domain-containing protein [Gammaproteobacteria bacterium]|jgi:hypothetical protein